MSQLWQCLVSEKWSCCVCTRWAGLTFFSFSGTKLLPCSSLWEVSRGGPRHSTATFRQVSQHRKEVLFVLFTSFLLVCVGAGGDIETAFDLIDEAASLLCKSNNQVGYCYFFSIKFKYHIVTYILYFISQLDKFLLRRSTRLLDEDPDQGHFLLLGHRFSHMIFSSNI